MIEKWRGASPQSICHAEGNPGPEKRKTVTSKSVTWRCLVPEGPNLEKQSISPESLENFKFSLEIFNLAWKLQSRLKFSILTFENSPTKIRVWWVASLEIFESRLKIVIRFESRLKISNPGGRSWNFSRFGPSGVFWGRDFKSLAFPRFRIAAFSGR